MSGPVEGTAVDEGEHRRKMSMCARFCGLPGVLVEMWCASGCSVANVAAQLAFVPPPPLYTLDAEASGRLRIRMHPSLGPPVWPEYTVDLVQTKRRNTIPVMLFECPRAKRTLLHSHANATDMGAMHHRYAELAIELGMHVVAYDYSGYGVATGRPTESDIYADACAAYDWAVEHVAPRPSEQLLVMGQSIGSGPAVYLAANRDVAGLVLLSPVLSGIKVITSTPLLCCLDIFTNHKRIRRVRAPTLIIHGALDEDVPVHHGEELFDLLRPEAKYAPLWVADASHNDVLERPSNRRAVYQRLRDFDAHVVAVAAERAEARAKKQGKKGGGYAEAVGAAPCCRGAAPAAAASTPLARVASDGAANAASVPLSVGTDDRALPAAVMAVDNAAPAAPVVELVDARPGGGGDDGPAGFADRIGPQAEALYALQGRSPSPRLVADA